MSERTADDRIQHFIGYYRQVAETAKIIPRERHGGTLRKLSLVAVIDSLAKAVYPRRGNRDRFTRTIQRFGEWPDASRVSLPHLQALLSIVPDPEFEELRKFVAERIRAWSPGDFVDVSRDLEIETARSKWPKDNALKSPVGDVTLEALQHSHLLYAYRNLLVHEFRDLPDPMSRHERDTPVYLTRISMDAEVDVPRWYLYYPTGFFQALTERIIGRVGEYLTSNGLDPTQQFTSAEFLVEELCD
jgi:hypothetical protein